jgi:mRNA interferase MazF
MMITKKKTIFALVGLILSILLGGIAYAVVANLPVNYDKYEVVLVDLKGSKGHEIFKTRPCVIVSPEDLNDKSDLLVIVPMTSKTKDRPFSVPTHFDDKDGRALVNQIRTVDKSRIKKKLGKLEADEQKSLDNMLSVMFKIDNGEAQTAY